MVYSWAQVYSGTRVFSLVIRIPILPPFPSPITQTISQIHKSAALAHNLTLPNLFTQNCGVLFLPRRCTIDHMAVCVCAR